MTPRPATLIQLLVPAALLVPLWSLPSGGTSHLVTCRGTQLGPFTIARSKVSLGGASTSSLTIDRASDAAAQSTSGCEGFELLVQARASKGRVNVYLPVKNASTAGAHASVELEIGGRRFPIRIGKLAPGETTVKRLRITGDGPEQTIMARLVVGP